MGVPPVDPRLSREAATGIVRTLREHGHEAYFAGGCVRDELLGIAPTDYDVATDATPARVAELFPATHQVGAAFGVVLVRTAKVVNEVATFRTDGVYTDKRRPDRVTFGTAVDDARRRDFTVNALFLDPLDPAPMPRVAPPHHGPSPSRAVGPASTALPRGRVIDLVAGMDDLKEGVLRAVGDPDQRLAEDHLRALRAVRLAARLGFVIDPATASAIRAHARALSGVSRERIGDEVRRMLAHPARAHAVELLTRLELDGPTLSERHAEPGPARCLGALARDAETPVALAAWAIDRAGGKIPKDPQRVCASYRTALCLSNHEHADLKDVLATLDALERTWVGLGVAGRRRLAAGPLFRSAMPLLKTLDPSLGGAVEREVAQLAATPPGLAPTALVDGDDLVRLGLRPGPKFKGLLDRLYDAQLEGAIRTKAEGLELARRLSV